MSYIYESTDGTQKRVNDESFQYKQANTAELGLEGLVQAGILKRSDVLDTEATLGEDASTLHLEMAIGSDGKAYVATNATQAFAGSLAKTGKTSDVVTLVTSPVSINRSGAGSIAGSIAGSSDLVVGAAGVLAVSQGAAVSLMSAVANPATGDFDNTVWGANGTHAVVDTVADNASARGATLTMYYINDADAIVKEAIQLDVSDSSVEKTTVGIVKKLLAISSNQAILVTSLQVKNETGTACKVIATPTINTVYGSVDTDDSDDPLDQSVQVSASTAPVADSIVVVKGTDKNNVEQFEALSFDGVATTAKTKKLFKTITQLLVGDDGVATDAYTVQVLANTSAQKVGVSPATAVTADSLFKVKRA